MHFVQVISVDGAAQFYEFDTEDSLDAEKKARQSCRFLIATVRVFNNARRAEHKSCYPLTRKVVDT